MINYAITRFWLWGGITGFLLPMTLFAIFQILARFRIAFGEHFLSALLLFILALVELPVSIFGRALNLPLETGSAAFMIVDLTPLGYVLVLAFWIIVGLLIGTTVDKILLLK